MAEAPDSAPKEDRRLFRPYRAFLTILVLIGALGLSALILRGIINTLDRLPSADRMDRLEVVDVRALRACADDLGRLEVRARKDAARALERGTEWRPALDALEIERLKIVARCRLDDPRGDPAIQQLARGATALENLLRTYTLVFDRIENDGRPEQDDLKAALRTLRPMLDER